VTIFEEAVLMLSIEVVPVIISILFVILCRLQTADDSRQLYNSRYRNNIDK